MEVPVEMRDCSLNPVDIMIGFWGFIFDESALSPSLDDDGNIQYL